MAPEELGQEETAQDDEANLAQKEYFRDILRGYSSEARRRLHQLNITGDPRSVLDEEWVQFFRDGLVETTYSGRGGVRSELKELIGKILGENLGCALTVIFRRKEKSVTGTPERIRAARGAWLAAISALEFTTAGSRGFCRACSLHLWTWAWSATRSFT